MTKEFLKLLDSVQYECLMLIDRYKYKKLDYQESINIDLLKEIVKSINNIITVNL